MCIRDRTYIIQYDVAFACSWWTLYTLISRGARIFAVLRLLVHCLLAFIIQKFASVLKALNYGEFLIFFNSIILILLFILISKSSGCLLYTSPSPRDQA
eukprot:TRINITY_DN15290_c0_g1_i1.p2 TRINITY_DN15290_c0_g1~~TRINITY_DN15290_c0_g1_i1.p2  ORF type:complete len:112 (-),score=33.77 TRINITY_DN15290_c0_g1_i1:29-325(-)